MSVSNFSSNAVPIPKFLHSVFNQMSVTQSFSWRPTPTISRSFVTTHAPSHYELSFVNNCVAGNRCPYFSCTTPHTNFPIFSSSFAALCLIAILSPGVDRMSLQQLAIVPVATRRLTSAVCWQLPAESQAVIEQDFLSEANSGQIEFSPSSAFSLSPKPKSAIPSATG